MDDSLYSKIKPGLVLKDQEFEFGYAVLTNKREGQLHFVTFYNNYHNNFKTNCEVIDRDYSLKELINKLFLDKFSLIQDDVFKEIESEFLFSEIPLSKWGIDKTNSLYNKVFL